MSSKLLYFIKYISLMSLILTSENSKMYCVGLYLSFSAISANLLANYLDNIFCSSRALD